MSTSLSSMQSMFLPLKSHFSTETLPDTRTLFITYLRDTAFPELIWLLMFQEVR